MRWARHHKTWCIQSANRLINPLKLRTELIRKYNKPSVIISTNIRCIYQWLWKWTLSLWLCQRYAKRLRHDDLHQLNNPVTNHWVANHLLWSGFATLGDYRQLTETAVESARAVHGNWFWKERKTPGQQSSTKFCCHIQRREQSALMMFCPVRIHNFWLRN